MNEVLRALVEEEIDANYVKIVNEANTSYSIDITLLISSGINREASEAERFLFHFRHGVRYWEGGVNINAERLNHLRFADHVVLLANSARETNEML